VFSTVDPCGISFQRALDVDSKTGLLMPGTSLPFCPHPALTQGLACASMIVKVRGSTGLNAG
jgi:hypothetical protein